MNQINIIEAKDIYSREEYKNQRKNLREKMVIRKKKQKG